MIHDNTIASSILNERAAKHVIASAAKQSLKQGKNKLRLLRCARNDATTLTTHNVAEHASAPPVIINILPVSQVKDSQ